MKRRDFLKSVSGLAASAVAPAIWSPAKADARSETLLLITENGPNNLDIHGVGTNRPGYEASWNCYDRLISHETKTLADGSLSYDRDKFKPELAEDMNVGDMSVTFKLKKQAKFQDGTPVKAQDVKWSLERAISVGGFPTVQMKAGSLVNKDQFVVVDDNTLRIDFIKKDHLTIPDLAVIVPGIYNSGLLKSKASEKDPWGLQYTKSNTAGSGAYKVGRFQVGHFIEYERLKDWWGADLPVKRGQNNFDTVRYEYYRDREVGFEGFSAGSYLFREEFTSRHWATRYDFPAIKDGRVKRDVISDDTPSGAQGWFINTRRDKFKDRRLREALIDAFDFEWTNKNIMYGSYTRTQSVFENSPMKAKGKPDAAELALLEPFRNELPAEVFGEPYLPPVTDASGQDRRWLRRANQLLTQAGFALKNGKRVLANGEPIVIEFLIDEPTFQPHHLPFIKNLGTLGIEASLRIVDPVQFRARVDNFDFDITVARFSFSATPGDSLRTYFTSQAAATKGAQNLAGIADPAVDKLVDLIIAAKTREELTTACRALDRVIRAGRYWIPHWYKASHWIAYWDVFGRPAAQPRYFRGIPETWWSEPAKAPKADQKG
jgi:microcin C transport system substrate-binding protein